jgi:inosose dehydratase
MQDGLDVNPCRDFGGALMKHAMTRRNFLSGVTTTTAALAVSPVFASRTKARNIQVGHTGITWPNNHIDEAITSIGSLGFYGLETFSNVLESAETTGGIASFLERSNLPLISGYCTINLVDPAQRADGIDKAMRWCGLIKKYNGRIYVVGPNQVNRSAYVFADHKQDIVNTLNELAKRVEDQGLTPVLHQHTGTCIESRDETYAVLEAVDTNHLKFGPDVGQLTKGGQDAVKVVKDFLPIVQHMHLKDFSGKDEHLLGYCPLGQGTVNVPAILDLMKGRTIRGMVMGELDNNFRDPSPTPPQDLVKQSHDYLETLGVVFRRT